MTLLELKRWQYIWRELHVCRKTDKAVSLYRWSYLHITLKPSVFQPGLRAVAGRPYPVTVSPDSFNMDAFYELYTLAHNHQRLTVAFRRRPDLFNGMLKNWDQHFLYSLVSCRLSLSHCNSVDSVQSNAWWLHACQGSDNVSDPTGRNEDRMFQPLCKIIKL